MVKTFTMKCPHCLHICDVFLSKNASVIILTCPSCESPMLYFDDQVFILSKNQIDTIRNTRHGRAIMRIMEHIKHNANAISCLSQNSGANEVPKPLPEVAHNSAPRFQKYITEDDVTNLRIELELCEDSGEFINKLP
jgi:hypothetical protein